MFLSMLTLPKNGPQKVQSHVYRGWPAADNTNGHKDTKNDVFALHSAPLALTATITMER